MPGPVTMRSKRFPAAVGFVIFHICRPGRIRVAECRWRGRGRPNPEGLSRMNRPRLTGEVWWVSRVTASTLPMWSTRHRPRARISLPQPSLCGIHRRPSQVPVHA